VTLPHLPLAERLARGLGRGAQAAIRRAGLMAAAGLIGAIGCGFVLFAAFAALRLLVGPELAALGVGVGLMAVAAILTRGARGARDAPATAAASPPPGPTAWSPPTDPTTLAVFTAAFVLGRRLADLRRD
jgi:hypothetical protein